MSGDGRFGEILAWTGLSAPVEPTAEPEDVASQPVAAGPRKPFVPPPWPFDSQPEPEAPAPAPAAVPFVPTPLPFAPTRHTFGPAPEPAVLTTAPAAPLPQPAAPPQRPFAPPPWPFDSPAERRAAAPEPVAAPELFVPTPLPFAPKRHTYEPPPEPVVVLPEPPGPARPRFGPMHAEATARAARFVAAQQGAGPARRSASRNGAGPTSNGQTEFSPKGAAILKAAGVYGVNPFPAPATPAQTASDLRHEAIERALARGRALADDADQSPARQQSAISSDQIGLGAVLACVLFLEICGGVVAFALGGGYLILAFGLALDACARMLGTIAAVRTGSEWGTGWRWACALIGSPAVLAFAFYGEGVLVDKDLARLAGPIAAFAIICVVVGLAGIPAGI